MARGMTECPFACGWSTDELMSDPELAAVEGGADRLQLHPRVEHGAHTERDDQAWTTTDPPPAASGSQDPLSRTGR